MSWQSDVTAGFAQRLEDFGVGTYDPIGAGGNIVIGALPPGLAPGVGIQSYRLGADDPRNPTTQLRLQFWLRAATLNALDNLDAAIYDIVQGLANSLMGVAAVTNVQSVSVLPMGVDGNGNLERASNYAVDLDLPATALRSY